MTVWTDNAARFAARAESRVPAQRHVGVRQALAVLNTSRDIAAALEVLLRSVESQNRMDGNGDIHLDLVVGL